MHESSFLAQSETSALSHLQNEFILSQERTMMELRLRNDSLAREIQQLQRTKNSHLGEEAELQFQIKSLREQLQFERDQCTTRRLSAGKYKEKFNMAQTAIVQLEKVNAALQRQLYQYRAKYETVKVSQEELAKGAAARTHDILQTHESLKEECRRLEAQLHIEKENNLDLQQQVDELEERLVQAQKKVADSESRQQKLKLVNATAYEEMQLNLQKILRKVDLLEQENSELRKDQHRQQSQLKFYQDQLEDVTRRYNFVTKKKAQQSARQLNDKLSPRKKAPY